MKQINVSDQALIRAYGIYWVRSAVKWDKSLKCCRFNVASAMSWTIAVAAIKAFLEPNASLTT